MCRLAAFPPGYTKEAANKIMSVYGSSNRDGVGIAYAKDGELVVKKWAASWESLEARKVDVFAHMPCGSWTIAHVRVATHGDVTIVNTHPFVKGDWAICHNGIFSGHHVAKALLMEMGATFEGQTDSEVGAELINRFGPKRFLRFAGSHDGTWLALNKSGELYAIVSGGACDVVKIKGSKGKVVIASALTNEGVKSIEKGWMRLNHKGKIRGGKYTFETAYRGYTSYPRGAYEFQASQGGKDWEKQWEKQWGRRVTRTGPVTQAELMATREYWGGD
jgi:glutamine phosphoribosylpyrophosphate amidotransferase